MQKRIWLALLCLGLAVFTMAFAACGDDDDDTGDDGGEATELNEDEQAASDYMDGLAATFNSDTPAFIAEFTEPALRQFLDDEETPIEDLKTQAEEFLAGETVEIVEFQEIEATADDATVTLVTTLGDTINAERFELAKEGEDFQIAGYEDIPEELPAEGVLDVSGVDFGYEFDGGQAESGVSAIAFTNDGDQMHEIALLQAAVDSPELDSFVEGLLEAEGPEDLPETVERFVTVSFATPGETENVVFPDEGLPAGRYVMVCFIPDETQGEEGPPHVVLGMAAEFTIQ